MSASKSFITPSRSIVTVERLIAICAVTLTALGFAQPQIMALAGFDFEKQHVAAVNRIDSAPTGSILHVTNDRAAIHGLAGTLKPLRARD